MQLETSQIDLDSIVVKQDFPEPDAEQVTYLANAISSVGGLIQIPVVKQLDLETYELIHGFFEYQAYMKARAVDSKLPDRLRVFVITKKNEKAIQQQIRVVETLAKGNGNSVSPELTIKLENLTSAVGLLQENVKTTAAENKTAILSAIDGRFPKPLPPLNSFNQINKPQVAKQVLDNLKTILGDNKAQQIIANLQKHIEQKPDQPFNGFAEVLEAAGKDRRKRRLLTEVTILKIIDIWK